MPESLDAQEGKKVTGVASQYPFIAFCKENPDFARQVAILALFDPEAPNAEEQFLRAQEAIFVAECFINAEPSRCAFLFEVAQGGGPYPWTPANCPRQEIGEILTSLFAEEEAEWETFLSELRSEYRNSTAKNARTHAPTGAKG